MVGGAVEARSVREDWFGGQAVFLRYLILRRGAGRPGVLTVVGRRGERVLPVFTTENAARAFLRAGNAGGAANGVGGWRVWGYTAGELVSLLTGRACEAALIAVDPPAGLLAGFATDARGAGFVGKREFVDALVHEPLVLASG